MLNPGPAKKVSIYGRRGSAISWTRALHGDPGLLVFSRGVSCANAVRGIAGFGADHKMHTARILDLTVKLTGQD